MTNRVLASFLAVSMSAAVLSACGSQSTNQSGEEASVQTESSQSQNMVETTNESPFVIEYPENMQQLGYTEPVVLDAVPERLVILTSAPVQALWELGVDMYAIPDTEQPRWSEELINSAEERTKSYSATNFDAESIVAMQPDLVMVNYANESEMGMVLEEIGIPVYYVDSGTNLSYESIKMQTQAFIDAFEPDIEKAEAVLKKFSDLEAWLEEIQKEFEGKKIMILKSHPPTHRIQTAQANLGSIAAMLGFENVYQNTADEQVVMNLETAISYEPDLILSCGNGTTPEAADIQKAMEEDFANNADFWQHIDAVQEGNIIYLPYWYSSSFGLTVVEQTYGLYDIIKQHEAQMQKE